MCMAVLKALRFYYLQRKLQSVKICLPDCGNHHQNGLKGKLQTSGDFQTCHHTLHKLHITELLHCK